MSQISKCPRVTAILSYRKASGEVSKLKQGGITCGAIDEHRKSSEAIDKRIIIDFHDKIAIIAHFHNKNYYFYFYQKHVIMSHLLAPQVL